MKKNLFKKTSITDTLINVGIGGGANVAMDYVLEQIPTVKDWDDSTQNMVKIAVGALVGSMITNKYARAAADGIATVGVSNLIAGYMAEAGTNTETGDSTGTEGLPYGTIGRIRVGSSAYRREVSRKGRSIAGDFIGK